ncbi:aa3-type cytochrome c oxidase subunit IV [Devosia limi]|uniref:Aa3 type cytochrome c oxidase subunit IV n=1 Tax=Devosia limi DSM 17137 TaxID=1121477 RepID=A0A1M4XJ48_9HYPH|nr:aa3-type cytochrome c oxidase subunit IV [Devosia limi]SHE93416.1 aa3 type cytochrome c oxidase subunit IV [Devosia limi DSM 17137]
MAKKTAEPHPPLQVESAMDYAEHEATYNGFITISKWTTIIVAASMVILYFLIIH